MKTRVERREIPRYIHMYMTRRKVMGYTCGCGGGGEGGRSDTVWRLVNTVNSDYTTVYVGLSLTYIALIDVL